MPCTKDIEIQKILLKHQIIQHVCLHGSETVPVSALSQDVWTRHLQCCFSESSVSICEIKFKFYYALCVSVSQSRKTTRGIPTFAAFQLCIYVKFSFRVKVYVQQWNVNRLGKMKGSSCPLTVPSQLAVYRLKLMIDDASQVTMGFTLSFS